MPPVFSSGYESFGLAAAESVACCCATVGPSEITVLGNDPLSPRDSFSGSTLNLLTQVPQIASASKDITTSLSENGLLFVPTTVTRTISLSMPNSFIISAENAMHQQRPKMNFG